MKLLLTPPRLAAVLLSITVLVSPAAVAYYYFLRMMRGDFPSDADSIGIPIFGHILFTYSPALYLLVSGLRRYRAGISLLSWPQTGQLYRATLSTVAFVAVALLNLALIADTSSAGFPGMAFYFVCHLYSIVVLRATSVGADFQPLGAGTAKAVNEV